MQPWSNCNNVAHRLEEFKTSIREGQEELARGEGIPFDVEEILTEAHAMYAQRHGS